MFREKIQQFKNALAIIRQIKNDEWEFKGHFDLPSHRAPTCYRAVRNEVKLWVADGWRACGIEDKPYELGIFGFFVWILAAKKHTRAYEINGSKQVSDLTK